MVMLADTPVTDTDIAEFERDGAICLRDVFCAEWIARMRRATERNIVHPGPLGTRYGDAKSSGLFHGDRYMWTFDPEFRAYAFESPAAAIAAAVLGARKLNLFYDHLLVKEPGSDAPTPWHQDLPYWCVDGAKLCSVWMPMDPVDIDSGGMEFVRGSHRWNRRFQAMDFRGDRHYAAELEPMPEIDRESFDLLAWSVEPGDCIVFHALTLHGAPGNRTGDRRRRALSTRWAGEDARYVDREGVTKPIRDPGLRHGDTLDCDLFPVVWQRNAD